MKLDYSPAERSSRPVRRVVLIASLCVIGLAVLISRESAATRQINPSISELIPEESLAESVAYEQAFQAAMADSLQVPAASEWEAVEVRRGANLSSIFSSQGLAADEALKLMKSSPEVKVLRRLQVGDVLHLRKLGDRLDELRFEIDELRTLHVRRVGHVFDVAVLNAEVQREAVVTSGQINSSLFNDGQKAGLNIQTTMKLADIFRYDVDFALDIRKGDRFTVVHEVLYKDGKAIGQGDVLAAEFVNQGKTHRAVRYVGSNGKAAFYTPDGQSIRKAFFRSPLDVVRISSHFNLRRRHPILNTIRAHRGVDYAARSGTPIRATGDGRVAYMGVKGGYGRVVVLKHGTQYETLYAHMSRYRRGLKTGSRVRQGQVIGYVGSSGLATAPHLHYEFRINGVHKNPIRVTLPRANPIPRAKLAEFKAEVAPLLAQLEADGATRVASNRHSRSQP
ncbi:MAG: M23 family metallopeptidase [Panacagrimonas sp.]